MKTDLIPTKSITEVRKIYGKILLDQGVSYTKIHEITGLARSTIAKIKHGMIETPPALVAAVKKAEHRELSHIGMVSRGITAKRLEADLESLPGEEKVPLSQVLKAQEVAFQQRRTLEGEASIIFDRIGTTSRIGANSERLAQLMKEKKEIQLRDSGDGVYEVDE